LNYSQLYACAFEGQYPIPYGKGLLLGAFEKQISRGVKAVPSMYLDGVETAAWTDPAKLLETICSTFTKKNPSASPPAGCNKTAVDTLRRKVARSSVVYSTERIAL
jgi:hypothetical protein